MTKPPTTPILCIGEVLWDSLPRGLFLGGAPFNVACHLRMLGETVHMASRIGDDELGRQILRRLAQKGLSPDDIQIDPQHPTGMVNVTLAQKDQPSYEIVAPSAWDFIEADQALRRKAAEARVLVFGSLAQRSERSRGTLETLRRIVPLNVFDINLRPPFIDRGVIAASLADAHLVKLNDQELGQLSEWFGLGSRLRPAVTALAERFQCATVCVTRGAEGALLWHGGEWFEQPGIAVEVKDAVGAGDAFLAGLIHTLLAGKNGAAMLRFANALGAYVASQDGATPSLNLAEIERLKSTEN